MAADWIKMRTDLGTSPKVVRIASALKADRLRVVGGLHSVWSLFDKHSEDGTMPGYSADTLDDMIGWPGFAAAMLAVNWLDDSDPERLALPAFDAHNGASAKRRAQDADRKRRDRNLSASDADEKRTREREEKRRNKSSTPDSSKPPLARADAREAGAPADGGLPPIVGSFEGHDDSLPPEPPNPAAPMAIALNRAGFRCTSLTPELAAAVEEGVTVEHVLQIAAWPECAGKPATYVIKIARREFAEGRKGESNGTTATGSAGRVSRLREQYEGGGGESGCHGGAGGGHDSGVIDGEYRVVG